MLKKDDNYSRICAFIPALLILPVLARLMVGSEELHGSPGTSLNQIKCIKSIFTPSI